MKFELHLHKDPFEKIKSGVKTVELRVNDEKRRKMKVNDYLDFISRENGEVISTQIEDMLYFPSFEELFKHVDKEAMGYDKDEVANPADLEIYYSKEEQEKYGVVAIKIRKC